LLIGQPGIHYPHCEQHDLPKLEKKFDALPLTPSQLAKSFSWKKTGDCARFDKEIIAGRDFNGRKFVSCAVTHPWATLSKKNTTISSNNSSTRQHNPYR
jgi:hypothetical protein